MLSVLRMETYDQALELINNLYGNGTAVFINDGGEVRRHPQNK